MVTPPRVSIPVDHLSDPKMTLSKVTRLEMLMMSEFQIKNDKELQRNVRESANIFYENNRKSMMS